LSKRKGVLGKVLTLFYWLSFQRSISCTGNIRIKKGGERESRELGITKKRLIAMGDVDRSEINIGAYHFVLVSIYQLL
jgi:hypothetical protein